MKKNYFTKIYGTGFSPSVNAEAKLKLIAKIILFACAIVLIALNLAVLKQLHWL